MFIFTFTAAILAVVCFGLAAFILKKRRHDPVGLYLGLHILAVAIWIGSNASADLATEDVQNILSSGLALIGSAFFISFYLCFVHAFTTKRHPPAWLAAIFFAPTAVFTLGAFSKYSIVSTMYPPGAPSQIVPGVLYVYISYFFLGSLLYGSVWMAVYAWRRATAQERLQAAYMEAGFFMLFVGAIVCNIILPLAFQEYRFYSAGPQFAVFLVLGSTYAIMKHRLLGIRAAVQRGVVFAGLFGLVMLCYLAVLYVVLFFFSRWVGQAYLLASIVTAVIGIFGVPPIQRFFVKATDRLFFRDKMSRDEAVELMGRTLNENAEMDELFVGVAKALEEIFRCEHVSIVVLPAPTVRATSLSPMTMEECRHLLGSCPVEMPETVLVMPVVSHEQVIALVGIGEKLSGDPYYSEDVDLLTGFAFQIAVAMEKSLILERAKERSWTLEAEVRERTAEAEEARDDRAKLWSVMTEAVHGPVARARAALGSDGMPDAAAVASVRGELADLARNLETVLRPIGAGGPTVAERLDHVDLAAVAVEVVDYFRLFSATQHVTVADSVEENLMVAGTKHQVEGLLMEIVGNAVKHAANERQVVVSLVREGDRAVLTVRDSGMGLTPQALVRLFRGYCRAPIPMVSCGRTLGLVFRGQNIEISGAALSIRSEGGRGTIVTVTVPLLDLPAGHRR